MDKQVKQEAVAKFSQLMQSGAAPSTVREAVGREFQGPDVDEIINALPKPDQDLPNQGGRPDQGLPDQGNRPGPDQDLPKQDVGNKPNQDLPDGNKPNQDLPSGKPGKPNQDLPNGGAKPKSK